MYRIIYWLPLLLLLFGCHSKYKSSVKQIDSIIEPAIYPLQSVADSIKSVYSNRYYHSTNSNPEIIENVKSIYQENNFSPIWKSDSLIEQGITLVNKATNHGLNPGDYNQILIDSLNASLNKNSSTKIQTLALLDIAISEGIMLLCKHLLFGKLIPQDYHVGWNYPKREFLKYDSLLLELIKSNRLMEIENILQPKTTAYAALKKELINLKKLGDGGVEYGLIKYPGVLLHKGDSNGYVIELKHELRTKGYILEDSLNSIFDSNLELAIKTFQKKHGLIADGVPGINTYKFLNWSLENYIKTIQVNMERMRWMSDSIPEIYISVNIPAYMLRLYSNKKLLFISRVIVGKYKNQTPVFESKIDYLVFNPCWTIPNSIASDKILQRIKTDTSYLDKHNMFVSLNGVTQDHYAIDFSKYNEDDFPYKIFQRTGEGNALGKVKFMFGNNYSIYLHDTPGKSLFLRDNRAFSHGCIRVQDAIKLSELLLHTLDNNSRPLSYYLDKGYPEKIYLNTQIALQLNYFTCEYNIETRQVQFYKDVYALDYKIYRDLQN